MVRMIIAAVLTLIVAFSAAAVAQQGARASRWQPEQFGPIVPTDTMWSIAGYYGRQQGVSMFDMMDSIVAANPKAFRDNRPDFMLTGFYLTIPTLGDGAKNEQRQLAAVAEKPTATPTSDASSTSTTVADSAVEPRTGANGTVDTSVENEIVISVSELQALRTQLSDSIGLIENLQGENTELQERLAAVTRELNQLRARADEEQQASTEMELLAEELGNEEMSSGSIAAEPETINPSTTDAEPDATAAAEPSEAQESAQTSTATESVVETPAATTTQVRETSRASAGTQRQLATWLDWLMKPLQIAVLGGVLLILLGVLAYALYVRRVNREIAEGGSTQNAQEPKAAAATEATVDTSAVATDNDSDLTDDTTDWQETNVADDYAEVTDVDLDEYLRDRQGEDNVSDDMSESEAKGATGDNDHDDAMSKEVDALLAMEFPNHDEASEAAAEASEPAEDVAEFRVTKAGSEHSTKDDEEDHTSGELDTALDSFGGLRLDDETNAIAPSEDEDYLSIESLMEEAETEASEDQDDPYNKDKLNDALGGDEGDANEIDLSHDAMLDDNKSPAAKLDLAQVYIDMGELEDARELLESIKGCGDEEAERDAAELLEKLAKQGGR